jgi:NAD(P)-dependent dehydrogenase (short-subunit alcohol dehydrogenase family)
VGVRVLISGAGRGLGRALCEESLNREWEVISWVRKPSDAIPGTQVLVSDVTDYPLVGQQLAQLAPQVDLLIINAGISELLSPKQEHCAEKALKILEVNTAAAIYQMRRKTRPFRGEISGVRTSVRHLLTFQCI